MFKAPDLNKNMEGEKALVSVYNTYTIYIYIYIYIFDVGLHSKIVAIICLLA